MLIVHLLLIASLIILPIAVRAGVLWKHTEYRTEHVETRRSRRLVISFFATIANYECEHSASCHLSASTSRF